MDEHKIVKHPEFFMHDLRLKTFSDIIEETEGIETKHRRANPKESKKEDTLLKAGNKLHSKINLPFRGGKVSVVCFDHRTDPKVCFCT